MKVNHFCLEVFRDIKSIEDAVKEQKLIKFVYIYMFFLGTSFILKMP